MTTNTKNRPAGPALLDGEEACAICGESARNAFCHIYREDGHTVSLCSPACAELFLHRPERGPSVDSGWFANAASSDTS